MPNERFYSDLELICHMNKNKRCIAISLTFAGALPFYLIPSMYLFLSDMHETNLNLALRIYAAVIISFLAGIHWGLFLLRDASINLFLHSNFVTLLAWLAASCESIYSSLVFAFCFIYLLVIDRKLFEEEVLESWFMRLRLVITLVVLVSLVFSAMVFDW